MKRPGYLFFMAIMVSVAVVWPWNRTLCLPQVSQPQPSEFKRLILKDGSYELISKYSIDGDRVRYFSAERFSWEELPYSMIDWDATEKYATRTGQEAEGRKREAAENAARERAEEDARRPVAAPGLRIPASEGVFLLDVDQGKHELNRLGQSGGDLNKNTGSNILRGIVNPIAKSRQTLELKGSHARIQAHIAEPVLFFSINPANPAMDFDSVTARDHLKIVRCENAKGNRVVGTVEIAVYGKVQQKAQYIDVTVDRLSDYWVRISPVKSMQPGEYALVEYDGKGNMNQFVWDFGVNPESPPNPANMAGDSEKKEPVLLQKTRKPDSP